MPEPSCAFDFEVVKREYDGVMQESGADFLVQTRVIDVVKDGDSIQHVVVAAPSGILAASPMQCGAWLHRFSPYVGPDHIESFC